MDYKIHQVNHKKLAEIISDNVLIETAGDILDLIANIPAKIFLFKKEMFNEDFFDLKTGIAGEILQKCSNYSVRMAIIGNFSHYTSQSLRDFIYECNSTNQIIFVENREIALEKLSK